MTTYHVTVQFTAKAKTEKGIQRLVLRIEDALIGNPAVVEAADGSVVDVVIEEAT